MQYPSSKKMVGPYAVLAKIGKGSYGKVYKARHINTGEFVAIKKIKTNPDIGLDSCTIREISVLNELSRHPNIIHLQETISSSKELHLVLEHMQSDLKQYIEALEEKKLKTNPVLVKSYMFQLLKGMDFCHQRRIVHRDLKPGNLLIDNSGKLKICDFGLARTFSVPSSAYSPGMVTLWYRAPEILLGCEIYSTPVDIWSIGCIFGELVNCVALFPGDNSDINQIITVFQICGTPTEENWNGVSNFNDYCRIPQFQRTMSWAELCPTLCADGIDLLSKMLQLNPADRISCKRALKHPYFSGFAERFGL